MQHLMVDNVSPRTFIRTAIVVGAEIDVRFLIFELLPGQRHGTTAAGTEKTGNGALSCEYIQRRKSDFRTSSWKNGLFPMETATCRRYSKEIEKT